MTWLLSKAGLRLLGAGAVLLLVGGLVLTGWLVRARIASLEDQVTTLEQERDRAVVALELSRANEQELLEGIERQGDAIRELQLEADERASRAAEAARQALAARAGERRQLEAEIDRLRVQAESVSACETAWLALRTIAREGV